MAEGIARKLAPADVRVFSAGSAPQHVHPLAIAAMRRRGIDLATHSSKGLDVIPLAEIDTVITLCEEEFCSGLGPDVERIHWPIPDPAATSGTEQSKLHAFQRAGDELERRIAGLFEAPSGVAQDA